MRIRANIEESFDGIDMIVAFRRAVIVVIPAFEDKADALGKNRTCVLPSQGNKTISDAYGRIRTRCTVRRANANVGGRWSNISRNARGHCYA